MDFLCRKKFLKKIKPEGRLMHLTEARGEKAPLSG